METPWRFARCSCVSKSLLLQSCASAGNLSSAEHVHVFLSFVERLIANRSTLERAVASTNFVYAQFQHHISCWCAEKYASRSANASLHFVHNGERICKKCFGVRDHTGAVLRISSTYVAQVTFAHQGRADRAGVDRLQSQSYANVERSAHRSAKPLSCMRDAAQ